MSSAKPTAKEVAAASTEPVVEALPNLHLLALKFKLGLSTDLVPDAQRAQYKEELLGAIKAGDMAPLYHTVCAQLGYAKDVSLVVQMEANNAAKLAELDGRIKDAEENLGESEVREALMARASYLCRIGAKDEALSAFRVASDKTVSLSQRLDISFTLARMGFFFGDNELLVKNIEKAKFQLEEGGDWDRKNRLKVYEGLYHMTVRDFKKASQFFLDGLATFSATELCSFDDFVYFACITGLLSLDRVTLKTRLMESPEVLSVIKQLPHVSECMHSLYNCNYDVFFQALAAITEQLKLSCYLAVHQAYFCREMRIRAYAQLLESYKSVQLKPMAATFGVTVDFLDRELSRFIFSGRLHCKIDQVAGTVETTRADSKAALYHESIRQGDALLNRVQRLTRVVNL